jgi:hypothetical protein
MVDEDGAATVIEAARATPVETAMIVQAIPSGEKGFWSPLKETFFLLFVVSSSG